MKLALRHAEDLLPGAIAAASHEAAGHRGAAKARFAIRTALAKLPAEHRWFRYVIGPLLDEPGMIEALPLVLDQAGKLPPLAEQDYRDALAKATWPAVRGRLSRKDFMRLTPYEQIIFGWPLKPAALLEQVAALMAWPPSYILPDESEPAQPISYVLKSEDELIEPPTVGNPPTMKEIRLDRTPQGTLLKIRVDRGSIPRDAICPYVEVDTEPTFSSANHLIWPPLCIAYRPGENPADRRRYALSLEALRQWSAPSPRRNIVLPVPVELLCLPGARTGICWAHLGALARRMKALGGRDERLARRAFDYAKYMIWFGRPYGHSGSRPWSALDTLRAGVGACGNLNGIAAMLLELCGVRVRGVAGFNPSFRTKHSGGGHSAFEFYDRKKGCWRYFDPFLDLFLPLPIEELANSHHGRLVINRFDGDELTLAQLFTYRLYCDWLQRLRLVGFLELADESSYGRDWQLASPDLFMDGRNVEDLAPLPRTLYVRCRYLMGPDLAVGHFLGDETASGHDAPPVATLSPWESRRFDITMGL